MKIGDKALYKGSPIVILHSDDNRSDVFVKDLLNGKKFNVHYSGLKSIIKKPTPISFTHTPGECPECQSPGYTPGVECPGCGLKEGFREWLNSNMRWTQ